METGPLTHSQLKAMKAKAKEATQERYLENSRQRFDKIMTTKMRTTFIGALAVFEESFGFMWGHGKHKSELTVEELAMREIWEQVRTDVLNKSNVQLRALKQELSNQIVSWKRYHLELPVKPLSGKE